MEWKQRTILQSVLEWHRIFWNGWNELIRRFWQGRPPDFRRNGIWRITDLMQWRNYSHQIWKIAPVALLPLSVKPPHWCAWSNASDPWTNMIIMRKIKAILFGAHEYYPPINYHLVASALELSETTWKRRNCCYKTAKQTFNLSLRRTGKVIRLLGKHEDGFQAPVHPEFQGDDVQ